MKFIPFERISPNQINVGDIIMCFCHDDQWERRAARVIDIEMDTVPSIYTWESGYSLAYEYRLWLVCRHINLKHLDAKGGLVYRWHRFPWNGVARYLLSEVAA